MYMYEPLVSLRHFCTCSHVLYTVMFLNISVLVVGVNMYMYMYGRLITDRFLYSPSSLATHVHVHVYNMCSITLIITLIFVFLPGDH